MSSLASDIECIPTRNLACAWNSLLQMKFLTLTRSLCECAVLLCNFLDINLRRSCFVLYRTCDSLACEKEDLLELFRPQ